MKTSLRHALGIALPHALISALEKSVQSVHGRHENRIRWGIRVFPAELTNASMSALWALISSSLLPRRINSLRTVLADLDVTNRGYLKTVDWLSDVTRDLHRLEIRFG